MGEVRIHPGAVVERGAELGADCEIGPFCHIGPHARLGAGCRLHAHVVLEGEVSLGDGCEVFPFACLGSKTQDLKYKGEVTYVRIGRHTVIREYVTVTSSTSGGNVTSVGDDCLIQSYCHIAHECRVGNRVVMSSGAMMAGHVEVDDEAVLGGMSGIVQFVKVGRGAMLGGFSKLVQDVLPYSIAEGTPAELRVINRVGMERRGKSPEAIRAVTTAFRKILRSGLTLDQAMTELLAEFPDAPEIREIEDFLKRSQKGLARPRAE